MSGMAVDFSGFAVVLKSLGVIGEVRELPDPAPTAASAAAQLGCEVGAIANSLVFAADGAPLLVMTSGAPSAANTRLFAIAPTSQPSCLAAAAAVGAGSGSSRTSPMTPSDFSTPANPEKSTAMPITLPARHTYREAFSASSLRPTPAPPAAWKDAGYPVPVGAFLWL